MQYKEIEISKISVSYNSRSAIKKDDLADLMQNIKEQGLLQPVGVVEKKGKYSLIFGNRRLQAFKKLGRSTIPAYISDKELSETEMILKNAAENIIRKDITMIELGKIALDLHTKEGTSAGEVAAALSITPRRVKNAIRVIQRAPKHIQEMIGYYNIGASGSNKKGKIPPTIINNIYSSRITTEQMNELAEYCRTSESNSLKVSKIIEFIKKGMTVKEAVNTVSDFYFITIDLIADKEKLDKIKKTYKSISMYVTSVLNGDAPACKGLFISKE